MKKIVLLMLLAVMISSAKNSEIRIKELYSPNYPIITFRVMIETGSINDPKGKEGLNALTILMLAQGGTKELTYKEIQEKLYPWAARINYQFDKEVSVIIGEVHRDHLEKFYKIFSDLILNPRFDEQDFKRNKDLLLNYIKATIRSGNDEELGKQALVWFIYENHPYNSPEFGTVQGLNNITLEDVKNFYKKHFTQGNIVFGIAGGYPKKLIQKIKRDFAKLPPGKPEQVKLPEPEKINGLEFLLIEKETRSTAISFGFPISINRSHKDFYSLMIANSYFGEHRTFNGILMQKIRGQRGLNYGDYSYIEHFVQDGGSTFPVPNIPRRQQYFSVWIRPVENKNRHFVLRQAIRELEILVKKGLSKEDFESTREFLLNYSKLWVQTLNRRLGYMMDSDWYGIEYFIDKIQKELPKLTVDDVNNAIRKYLNFENIKIVAVTKDAKSYMDDLISNKPSPITYVSPVAQSILDEDKIIQEYKLNAKPESFKIIPVDEVFEK
ncbi:zinc protease [Candidatus Kryptobacter tengchongensis]|uniref:Zinc protease n=1 Tax=Kryptobacter tengchongensis TaxID=1643429 RepID=A0A656DEZ5_KRYT1|nr:pitrilysin family protein [Candidatus Kryptobacter tengchongensis]CUT05211.1 zinc protease [Candidatus Kryptobacter tengchongensis]CUU04622.1 zinc protease [Candidatus Kryptobacter tengchongensis]CUU10223.1 zinc protease [Candidatus Kryptobacter tengchongensis]